MKRLPALSVSVVLCAAVILRAGAADRAASPAIGPTPERASSSAPRLTPNDTVKEFCTGCHNQYDLKG